MPYAGPTALMTMSEVATLKYGIWHPGNPEIRTISWHAAQLSEAQDTCACSSDSRVELQLGKRLSWNRVYYHGARIWCCPERHMGPDDWVAAYSNYWIRGETIKGAVRSRLWSTRLSTSQISPQVHCLWMKSTASAHTVVDTSGATRMTIQQKPQFQQVSKALVRIHPASSHIRISWVSKGQDFSKFFADANK